MFNFIHDRLSIQYREAERKMNISGLILGSMKVTPQNSRIIRTLALIDRGHLAPSGIQ